VVAPTSQHLHALREAPQTPTQITQEEHPPFSLTVSRHHRRTYRTIAAPMAVGIKQITHLLSFLPGASAQPPSQEPHRQQ